jgi:hypothetical protein
VNNVDINDIYQKRPWVAGSVNGSDGAIVSTLGRYPFTVDRRGAGGYDISWSSNTMPSTQYIVQCTVRNAHGTIITSQAIANQYPNKYIRRVRVLTKDRSFTFHSILKFLNA